MCRTGIQKAKRQEVEKGNAAGLGLRATGGGPNSEYGVQVSSVPNYIANWVKARDAIHFGPSQHLRIQDSNPVHSRQVDADLVHQGRPTIILHLDVHSCEGTTRNQWFSDQHMFNGFQAILNAVRQGVEHENLLSSLPPSNTLGGYPLPVYMLREQMDRMMSAPPKRNALQKPLSATGYLSMTFSDTIHWRVIFADSEHKQVYAWDPYGAGFLADVFDHLKRAFSGWECTLLDISLQSDGYNCGAWCLLMQQLWLHFTIDSQHSDFKTYAIEQLVALGYHDLGAEPTRRTGNVAKITEFKRALQADVIKLLDDTQNYDVQMLRSDEREAQLRAAFQDVIDLTKSDGHTFVSEQFGVPKDVTDDRNRARGKEGALDG
ncbi:hypothetical protein CYMTET_52140 [Cymbomonas tetramitiformis]|uniref:Ubiquitin-like protease family profile domain-containing protein n=1 Tax=Cymbomonas tetramitiformis TaxID=36881 RepID=A0AAE0BKS5_9CHLO|nr:hypothetical protein CYMTET_52140 [Cymbomonas tetramitiformis]